MINLDKKSNEMTTIKVVVIVLLVLLFLIGIIYLVFICIPKNKINSDISKYYGEWVLVDNDYDNVLKIYDASYTLKKSIIIDINNIESQVSNSGCGFNIPKKEYGITSYYESGCSNDYYLITSLSNIVDDNKSNYPLDNIIICFELNDKSLTQMKCGLDDNTVARNVGITYKLK